MLISVINVGAASCRDHGWKPLLRRCRIIGWKGSAAASVAQFSRPASSDYKLTVSNDSEKQFDSQMVGIRFKPWRARRFFTRE